MLTPGRLDSYRIAVRGFIMGRTMIKWRRTARTFYVATFLKEHVEKKSTNKSEFIRSIMEDYYEVIIENSEGNGLSDYNKVFISIGMNEKQQQRLETILSVSPHTSASDLVRTALWLDYMRDKKFQKAKNPYPVAKDFVRVPVEDSFVDFKIIGEA